MSSLPPAPSSAPGPSSPPTMAAWNGLVAKLSQGERLIGGGVLLVLVIGELLLGSLFGAGGIGITSVLATTTILVAIAVRHTASAPLLSAHLYAVVLVVLVALVAVPALSDLLSTIHLGFGERDAIDLLFSLAYWVGAAVMAWGAIVFWRTVAR